MDFNQQVDDMVGASANAKGYDGGHGPLWELCKTLPHALGEIVYKVVRYHRKGDPTELVKIAAWARLEWEDQQKNIACPDLSQSPPVAHLDAHVEYTAIEQTIPSVWKKVPLRTGVVNVFCDWSRSFPDGTSRRCRYLYDHKGEHEIQ